MIVGEGESDDQVGWGWGGGRERQTGCKGFCAGGDGLDGGDSYAEPFILFLCFFSSSSYSFLSIVFLHVFCISSL